MSGFYGYHSVSFSSTIKTAPFHKKWLKKNSKISSASQLDRIGDELGVNPPFEAPLHSLNPAEKTSFSLEKLVSPGALLPAGREQGRP